MYIMYVFTVLSKSSKNKLLHNIPLILSTMSSYILNLEPRFMFRNSTGLYTTCSVVQEKASLAAYHAYLLSWSQAGLGICSLVFQVNCSFFVSKRAKEQNSNLLFSKSALLLLLFCKEWQEQIAHGRYLELWSTERWSKEQQSKERREWFALGHENEKSSEKLPKTWWNQQIFLSESIIYWEQKSESVICSQKTSESLMSIFVKEQFALVTLL